MNCIHILISALVISCLFCSGGARKISCFVNPGLNPSLEDQNTNVVHIVSEGENDVMHYIWSTYELPSVIVARTMKNTSFLVNTTKLISFKEDAITYKGPKPLDSVGLTFTKLWELHYPKDTSTIYEISSVDGWDLDLLSWTDVNGTLSCSDTFASATLKANNNELPFSKNGTLKFQFSVSADQELSGEFPHLVFTGNSTMLKVVLDDLYSNSSKTRYGLGVSIFSAFSADCKTDSWNLIKSKSINDEFSPGVFTDVQLLAPCSDETKESSFLSWRPVAYIGEKPIVANSSDVTMMTDKPVPAPEGPIHSIAELYFAERSNISVFNLTFGTQGDGFYHTTEYTAWSLMLGTGQMVEIPLSPLVMYLAAIGIGLTLLSIVCGAVFMLYQRFKAKDDDLLLN